MPCGSTPASRGDAERSLGVSIGDGQIIDEDDIEQYEDRHGESGVVEPLHPAISA